MTVSFNFEIKTDDAVCAHADGTICACQADLVGIDDADGERHAVTIRCEEGR